MNHRERFQAALAHREPDRVPLDIGGSIVTSIAAPAYKRLVAKLNLPERDVIIESLYSQTARIDEDVFTALDGDTRHIDIYDPADYKLEFEEKDGYRYYVDEWTIKHAMPLEGQSGYSAVQHPLANATSVSDVEAFNWPDGSDPTRFKGLEEQVHDLVENKKVGVILETNIGGVYEWPGWLRGMENFLMDMAGDSATTEALLEKITDHKIAYWEAILTRVGNDVDLVRESDDLAGQSGLLISPEMYRKYFKPCHKRICEAIRKHTDATICLHSCGGIWDMIPDLMEAGFNGLNPVQVGTAKMDPVALKKEFGKDLVFWGGAVDSQILPTLTVEQVKDQVRANIEALAPGGGYIVAPINMIQADVPAENIIAIAEAVREYGNY